MACGVLVAYVSYAAQDRTCELRERHMLWASDGLAGELFGTTGLDGDHAIVGASRGLQAGSHMGSAYVFRHHDNGTPSDPHDDFWFEQSKLIASDAASSDQFGADVGISGDWAVVGAMRDDDMGRDSGSAYIFRRDHGGTPLDPMDDTWVEQAKLVAADGRATDHFADFVAIDGDRALIGAPYHDLGLHSYFNGGTAYVFRRHANGTPDDLSDDTWLLEQELEQQNSQADDRFGSGVSIEERVAVVGSFMDGIVLEEAGAATVFYRRDDNWWIRQALLTASDAAPFDHFGINTNVSGDWIAVGASGDDDRGDGSGSVYLFRRDDNGTPAERADDNWIEHAKLTASDGAELDNFGYKVSIDGDWLTVSSFNGGQGWGDRLGAVYVFRRDDAGTPDDLTDDVWNQHDKLRRSDIAPNDLFGYATLSGRRVLVGSAWDDSPDAQDIGSAAIFELGQQCVTLAEFSALQNCYRAAGTTPACEDFDYDSDGDVDTSDYREFLLTFSGP